MILAYYTALILGYKIDGEHLTARFWMQSYAQCGAKNLTLLARLIVTLNLCRDRK